MRLPSARLVHSEDRCRCIIYDHFDIYLFFCFVVCQFVERQRKGNNNFTKAKAAKAIFTRKLTDKRGFMYENSVLKVFCLNLVTVKNG